MTKDNTVGV